MALLVAPVSKTFLQAQEPIAALLERASKLAQQQIVEASPDHEDSKTLLTVALQVSTLVANLKVACAYLSQMNQTYEKVSSAVKEKIALLGTWCTDLESKNIEALKSRGTVDQAFQDNSLSWMPRIDSLSLQVVNSSRGELTVTGYFPYGHLQKWEHSFIFNNKRFDRTEASNKDRLKYDLDLQKNSIQEKYTVLTGTLRVEWQTSYLVTKQMGWKTSEFPCVFSVTPSIGRFEAVLLRKVEEVFESDVIKIDPSTTTGVRTFRPSGWQVKPGSANIVWQGDKEDKVYAVISKVTDSEVSCDYRSSGGSGSFKVTYIQSKDEWRNVSFTDLTWGSALTYPLEVDERVERLIFNAFNKEDTVTLIPANKKHRFVEFAKEENYALKIKIKKAEEV